MRVAIIHYWLVGMRGGERVIESLCEIFPNADIFTHVYDPDNVSNIFARHKVYTTFINHMPRARYLYQKYLPLMPLALEELDLRDYDIVISSESGPAKGVITGPDTIHICYCHTPMRYAWNMYHDYRESINPRLRPLMSWLIHRLRAWDFQSAARVDAFLANSHNVARRIRKYYRRDAVVVYPPVEVDRFQSSDCIEDFYLYVGQLVRYKRVDLAIEAFNSLGKPLVVIGDGEERDALEKLAGPTIRFLGRQDFDPLRDYYSHCRALIFPGEEDFGIVPVEAMASGRPVIAFGHGGALETVIPGKTGLFFNRQSAEELAAAVIRFEAMRDSFDRYSIIEHARRFSSDVFRMSFLKEAGRIASEIGNRQQAEFLANQLDARFGNETLAHRLVNRSSKASLAS